MKTIEWQRFFSEQRAQHNKVVFRPAELANAAGTTLHSLNTELGRLLNRGIVIRYAQGLYGYAEAPAGMETVVPELDFAAYITGHAALFRASVVTQVPTLVTCFTNRRHNRRRDSNSPIGQLKFICVPAKIYSPPRNGAVASPEQALCDYYWLSLKDGTEPQSLVTFRNLERLNRRKLNAIFSRYPVQVHQKVADLLTGHGRDRNKS